MSWLQSLPTPSVGKYPARDPNTRSVLGAAASFSVLLAAHVMLLSHSGLPGKGLQLYPLCLAHMLSFVLG